MRAALHNGSYRLDLIEKPVPELEDGEALLRVQACGFCGSDKHDLATPAKSPNTPGHEISGIVEAVRGAANGFSPGDRVVVSPKIACGACPACRRGEIDYCERVRVYGCRGGHQPPGGFAQFVKVRAVDLIRLPDGLSFEEGSFADPVAVGIHSLELAPKVEGANVAIFGAGTIGLVAAQLAHRRGAGRVFLIDREASHLRIASNLGPFETILAKEDASHLEALRSREIDLSLELAGGNAPTLHHAIETTRRGGTILLVSQRPEGAHIDYQHVVFWEQRLQGVFGYRQPNFPEAIAMMGRGEIDVKPLITHRFSLDRIGEALAAAIGPDSIKVMVNP